MGTFASSETELQYPPVRENFPLPIRARISSGVSSGPLANGVNLRKSPVSVEYKHTLKTIVLGLHTYPVNIVYRRTPKLQISQAAS